MTLSITKAVELARRVDAYGKRCDDEGCAYNQGPTLAAAVLAMAPVVESAREWAESTRQWPPDGDNDALNALLEAAQNFYNSQHSEPPAVIVDREYKPAPTHEDAERMGGVG